MVIVTEFDFFDRVYLTTDPYQYERVITEIRLCPGPNGSPGVIYRVNFGSTCTDHYAEELTREKDLTKTI